MSSQQPAPCELRCEIQQGTQPLRADKLRQSLGRGALPAVRDPPPPSSTTATPSLPRAVLSSPRRWRRGPVVLQSGLRLSSLRESNSPKPRH
jgi:hypothetical protein